MAKRLAARLRQRRFRDAVEAASVGLMVVAGHLQQRIEDICARRGITHMQYNVLRILRGAQPEGRPRFEIAERLITRAPDVTRLLDRLDRQELIARGWHRENRRHSVARITPKGLALLDALDPELAAVQADVLGSLSAPELEALAQALDKLTP